jgi:hypothetical protein
MLCNSIVISEFPVTEKVGNCKIVKKSVNHLPEVGIFQVLKVGGNSSFKKIMKQFQF